MLSIVFLILSCVQEHSLCLYVRILHIICNEEGVHNFWLICQIFNVFYVSAVRYIKYERYFCYLRCVHNNTIFFLLQIFFLWFGMTGYKQWAISTNQSSINSCTFIIISHIPGDTNLQLSNWWQLLPKIYANKWTLEVTMILIQALLHSQLMSDCQHCFFSRKAVSSLMPQHTKVKKFEVRREGAPKDCKVPGKVILGSMEAFVPIIEFAVFFWTKAII